MIHRQKDLKEELKIRNLNNNLNNKYFLVSNILIILALSNGKYETKKFNRFTYSL